MNVDVHPSPVTLAHGHTSTKARMIPHPPSNYRSSNTRSYQSRVPHATRTASSTYKPLTSYSGSSSGLGNYSTTNRDSYRSRPSDLTRRYASPITAKYEPKSYDDKYLRTEPRSYDDKYSHTSSHRLAARNAAPDQYKSSVSRITQDMVRLPMVDDQRPFKSSFGSIPDNLYKSSIEDLNAPRPRDSSESRTSSTTGTSEVRDRYGGSETLTRPIPVNRQSSLSTLRRTPSLLKSTPRRSSVSEFSSRSTAGEYGLSTAKGAGRRGLKNIGNTCYMNTIVQCLSSVPELTEYCRRVDYLMHKDVNANSYHSGKLFQEFAATVKKLWDSDSNGYYTPFNLKRQIGNMLSHEFRGYRQHDAAEFLLSLLAELSEDVNKVKDPPRLGAIPDDLKPADLALLMWRRQQQLTQSIIFDLFNGLTRSTLRCSTCDYVSVTFELFYDLSVPIPTSPSRPTLANALELYTKPETLSGDNQFLCEKCKAKRSGTKKMEIERCPNVLIIQLKRFSSSHSGLTRKVDIHVDFPVQGLNLADHMPADATPPSSRYQLQAVCNHYGGTAGGHYIAYCRHQEDHQWYKFDDDRVTSLKECNVVTSNAYILFYVLKPKFVRSDSRL